MAKYVVMVETLGANPTHVKGEIIEDSGDQRSMYDIRHLLRIGAIEKMQAGTGDREAQPPVTTASEPAPTGPDMVTAPDEQMPKSVEDFKAQQDTAALQSAGDAADPLANLDGEQQDALRAAGFGTADAIRGASDDELDAIPGVGPATVKKIRAAVGA